MITDLGEPSQIPASDGMCNWCRDKRGDIFCEGFPICFECVEILIDRENSLELYPRFRNKEFFEALTPWGWESD